jgi:hypothetical protein
MTQPPTTTMILMLQLLLLLLLMMMMMMMTQSRERRTHSCRRNCAMCNGLSSSDPLKHALLAAGMSNPLPSAQRAHCTDCIGSRTYVLGYTEAENLLRQRNNSIFPTSISGWFELPLWILYRFKCDVAQTERLA